METQERPDFRKYTLPPVSRKYLLRIIVYLILLSLVAVLAIYMRGTHKKQAPEDIQEIHQIEVELPEVELQQEQPPAEKE